MILTPLSGTVVFTERLLVHVALHGTEHLACDELHRRLTPDSFISPVHQRIWAAICDVRAEGGMVRPFDVFARLTAKVPALADPDWFAELLHDECIEEALHHTGVFEYLRWMTERPANLKLLQVAA